MKLKDGFILQKIAGENVVLPSGDDADLYTIITLNNVGAFLWKLLEEETDEDALSKALVDEYEIDEARASNSVQNFVKKLKEQDFLA